SGNRKAPTDQRAFGEMPPIAGLDPATPRKTYDYNVSIGQAFQSTWLPTQAPISRINAAGDWRYDTSTMDFMSFDQEHTNAQGETYTMTAVKPQLDPDELNSATSSTALAGTEFTDLPEGLPDIVTQEALAQTADYTTKYEK